MISIDVSELTQEDLAYSILSSTAIDFGYVTNKERRTFFKSLIDNQVIVKVNNSNSYQVKCAFVYRTVKTKRTDDCVYVSNLFRKDIIIDKYYREIE